MTTVAEPDGPRFAEPDGDPDEQAVAGCVPPAYDEDDEPYHGARDRAGQE